MRFLRNYLRFLAAIQLLPALESGEETLVGGQAVLEGVMMRSPHAWAIACRKPKVRDQSSVAWKKSTATKPKVNPTPSQVFTRATPNRSRLSQ